MSTNKRNVLQSADVQILRVCKAPRLVKRAELVQQDTCQIKIRSVEFRAEHVGNKLFALVGVGGMLRRAIGSFLRAFQAQVYRA